MLYRENTTLFGLVGFRAKVYRHNGNYLVPIYRLGKSIYKGEVYNLDVDNRHTYCANGVVVHNCSYPITPPIPFKEESLWDGYPEPTNAPYGIAKRTLLTMCQAYREQYSLNSIYLMPVNLYGPYDHFGDDVGHVIPMLIKRFLVAEQQNTPEVIVWGSGKATREFFYVEDCAKLILKATQSYDGKEPMNLGSGSEISIKDLSFLKADIVKYKGKITFDPTKPEGQPRRVLDISKSIIRLGFDPNKAIKLEDGLRKTIEWYKNA
jgi:GDP-L-fucose synthase